jgi:chorismate synthase
MHAYGNIFKIQTWGVSHTQHIGVVIDGVPAGMNLSLDDFAVDLNRRKAGFKGTTPRVESDIPEILSGVLNGKTTGSPVHIQFDNEKFESKDYIERDFYRPGHADFAAQQKYSGFQDKRGGGFFSGRMTVLLVAAGVLAKKILGSNVEIRAEITHVGGKKKYDNILQQAIKEKDSLGARIECQISGVSAGIGEPVFNSIESVISHLAFAIPGVKAIAFGDGEKASEMKGSEFNDVIIDEFGKTETNHNGGINGGLSNGNPIVFSLQFKPTSSIGRLQKSWNTESASIEEILVTGKHDVCYALRAPVIVEAVAAIALTDLIMMQNARML